MRHAAWLEESQARAGGLLRHQQEVSQHEPPDVYIHGQGGMLHGTNAGMVFGSSQDLTKEMTPAYAL